MIVLYPDHCFSIYFVIHIKSRTKRENVKLFMCLFLKDLNHCEATFV